MGTETKTETELAQSYIGTCRKCWANVGAIWTPAEALAAYRCVACECGNRAVICKAVKGKRGKRGCDDYCTTGVGRSCTCECEGRNHGAVWRVK